MKHADILKLKWLRLEAINDLQSEEHDLIVEFTERYQKGEAPLFTDEDIHKLSQIYNRVRNH